MSNALELVSAIRHAIKALNFEIAELQRPRRGLSPGELASIKDRLQARHQAKFELTEFLNSNDLSIN